MRVGVLCESGASAPSFKDPSKHVEVGGTRDVVAKNEGRLRLEVGRSVREVPGDHKEGESDRRKFSRNAMVLTV